MRGAAIAAATLLLLGAGVAWADDDGSPTEQPFRRSVQLQGSLGLSDCLGGGCSHGDRLRISNTRVGLGLDASGWWRLLPLVSVGGGLHFNLLGLSDLERVTSTGDYWTLEVGGRVHPLRLAGIDAFAGVGLGYIAYSISARFSESDLEQDESTDGLFVAFTVGGEYAFAPRMSVGGLLRVTLPWWMSQCLETRAGVAEPQRDCDDIADQSDTEQDFYPSSVWYLGGTFSYRLGG